MKGIRPGELRHLINIQTDTVGRDAVGGVTHSWATTLTAWAKIEPLQGFESESSNQVQARTRFLMTILYQSGITSKLRINWDSRNFDIDGVQERREGQALIMLTVVERDAS